jgi:hypothetical protein
MIESPAIILDGECNLFVICLKVKPGILCLCVALNIREPFLRGTIESQPVGLGNGKFEALK